MKGLLKLTLLELKIFAREPMGLAGTILIPVAVFIAAGKALGPRVARADPAAGDFVMVGLPVLAALLIAFSAVLSLITIIAIYREGGILKRLRATPLRPHTILTAHVLVKLLLTAVTLALLVLAGRRFYPAGLHIPVVPFGVALLVTTLSILSMGFLIASLVPTARFAQPIAGLILYPMLGISGLFVPLGMLPPAVQSVALCLPVTYAVSLLKGILAGEPWLAHTTDLVALAITFVTCTALSSRVFRWE